jgi:hypothetical protein
MYQNAQQNQDFQTALKFQKTASQIPDYNQCISAACEQLSGQPSMQFLS